MRLCALGLAVGLATAPTMIGAEIERRHAPTIGIDGVVNAASFRAAPDNFLVPNGIFSIFGEGWFACCILLVCGGGLC